MPKPILLLSKPRMNLHLNDLFVLLNANPFNASTLLFSTVASTSVSLILLSDYFIFLQLNYKQPRFYSPHLYTQKSIRTAFSFLYFQNTVL